MSASDNRIVNLSFNNRQFEEGIKQSSDSLDKFEKQLAMTKGQEGLSKFQSAIDKVDFSAMARGIESLEQRFSTFGIAGMNIVNRITDSIINSAKRLESATLGQIKSGGWTRASNIANAKFTIEGLKYSWDEVREAADYAVTDTAYGLDSAAKAASQLAASGVDFSKVIGKDGAGKDVTQMHKSLRAISGVAAMTNSSYDDIAHTFTRIAGQGRVMGEDLNSLAARGLNAAATLATAMNTTEAEIRDMVSKGKIGFAEFSEAMDSAYGDHAKEANKTFTGALSNMKAALSRIGAIFAQPVIDKTNVFFVAVTDRIKEFQRALNDTTDEDGNKIIRFAGHFEQAWTSAVETASDIIHKLDLSWFGTIAEKMDGIAQRTKTFFDDLKYLISDYTEETKDGVDSTGKTISVTAEEAAAAKRVIDGAFGNGAQRAAALEKAFGADSAKRIQDYVDSVAAAGWNYEKAAIKVVQANEAEADSVADLVAQQKLQRKIKFHTVINNLSVAFSNLGRAAKNIFTAISKVGTAIYNAFASVFGFKQIATSASEGLRGLLIRIADFTEKLIISDDAAEKIKGTATKVFEIAKTAITFIWNMLPKVGSLLNSIFEILKKVFNFGDGIIHSVIDSDLFKTIIDAIKGVIDYLTSSELRTTLKDNPILGPIGKLFDGLKKLVSDESGLPSALTKFVNTLMGALSSINLFDVAKLVIAVKMVSSIATFVLAMKNVGSGLEALTRIPGAITSFLFRMGVAAKMASTAYAIASLAKAIATIAGIVIVMGNMNESAMYRGVAMVAVIVGMIILILKYVDKMMSEPVDGAVKSAFRVSGKMASLGVALKAIGTLIASIGATMALIGAAMVVIERSGATWITFAKVAAGMLLTIAIVGLLIDQVKNIKAPARFAAIFTSLAAVVLSIGVSVLLMSMAMAALSAVPVDKVGSAIVLIGSIFLGLIGVLAIASQANPASMLSAAVLIAAAGLAMSVMFVSLGVSFGVMATAAIALQKTGTLIQNVLLPIIGIVASVFLAVYALSGMASKGGAKMVVPLLAMSVLMIAFGSAMSAITLSMSVLSTCNPSKIEAALRAFVGVIAAILVLVYTTSKLEPKQMLSSAVMFVGLSVAIGVLSAALSALSLFGNEKMITAAESMFIMMVGLASAVAIASAALTANQNKVSSIVASVISVSAATFIIASALKKLGNVGNVITSAIALGVLLVVIAGAIGVLSSIGGGKSSEGIMSVGSAFIMIAASLYVLALAIEKVASITDNLVTVAVVFGVFLVSVIALSVIGTIFAGVTATMLAIGKAMMYAGAGFALVGAGVFLVCEGIKILAPSVALLAAGLEVLFKVLEDHKVTAIIVLVIVAAIITALVLLAGQVAPLLTKIVEVVGGFLKSIGGMLSGAMANFTNFVATLSTRGKVLVISLITTICSALVSASPKVISAIGTMILRLFEYLGKIAGSLALALVDFIINLINALAEAIMANSARIINALFNVIYALGSLLVSVVGQFFSWIPGADEMFEGVNEEMLRIMEERKAVAEEADRSKKDYLASLKEMEEGTEEVSTKSSGFLGGLFDKFSDGTDKVNGLTDAFEGNKSAFTDMVRVQGIPVEIPASTVKDGKVVGNEVGGSIMSGLNDSFSADGMVDSSILQENGVNLGENLGGYMGEGLVNEAPELYTTTTTVVEEGPVEAIEDSAPEIRKTTKEFISDTMIEVIGDEGERKRLATRMWSNAAYMLRGFSEGVDDNLDIVDKAMGKVVDHVDQSFIGPMQIKSPSKLFAKYGNYIVQGLSNGISDETSTAEASMGTLSDRIISLFSDPLSYISRIVSGELQIDPSVQPILDTSRLSKGSSAIGAVLNGQSITVAGLSSQLAADIGQLDSRNLDIVMELRALREDMAVMGEEISNMQVVMDTGALVGATAGPMDKALGQRAVRFGRGT